MADRSESPSVTTSTCQPYDSYRLATSSVKAQLVSPSIEMWLSSQMQTRLPSCRWPARELASDEMGRYLELLGAEVLVVGHTHAPMWRRWPAALAVNPGSLVDRSIIRSSRTFAVVDLDTLEVTFHDVETGGPIAVPPIAGC